MVNYTEILRLAAEGRSQRQIAASVRSSRNTVSEVIHCHADTRHHMAV